MRLQESIIWYLGGYPTINDAIAAIHEKNLPERSLLLTLAVKKLFNTISADDILKEHAGGVWTYAGKEVSPDLKKELIADAHILTKMTLWKILCDDVRYQANRKMFLLAEKKTDIIAGKLWTLTLDCFTTRINSLLKESGTFHKK